VRKDCLVLSQLYFEGTEGDRRGPRVVDEKERVEEGAGEVPGVGSIKAVEESRTKHVGGGATGGSLGSDGGGGEKKKDGRENGADGEERERSTEGPKEGR
jgi:hypothetical protein